MGSRGHIPRSSRPLENVYIETQDADANDDDDASRASSIARWSSSSSGTGRGSPPPPPPPPPSAAGAVTLPPKTKARSKKRKPPSSSSSMPPQKRPQLNVTLQSTPLLDRRRLPPSPPTWRMSPGERALLLQPAVENASSSAAGGLAAQGDHSAAAAGLLLLSEEVATVSAAVASVCAFWVLLGTALCFVLRVRRRKRRRQRRRSRADAAQTAMLDEMIRSELARGRARLQCDGVEYCAPTYANVPRHLIESANAFDAVDSENLYCSIPATIHSDDGTGGGGGGGGGGPRPNGPSADASRSHDRRSRPTGSGPRNVPGTCRVAETVVDTKTCSARLDHSRTQRCQDSMTSSSSFKDGGGLVGKDTSFIAREMSIRVTTVGLRQCGAPATALTTGFGRVPAGGGSKKCKHSFNDSRANHQKDVGLVERSRRKDAAGQHPMQQSKAGRTGRQEWTYPDLDKSNAVLPHRQFCAAISSNSNYCSDVSNFRCRHHATVEGRPGDVKRIAMTPSLSLSHRCPAAQGASGGAAAAVPGGREPHGGELRPPPPTRPCTVAGATSKAPVRFPKMGRSCLVMGELIRRDWVWRLGGGQPLGSLPICERCTDPCSGGRGLPADVSMNNI